MTEIFRTHPLTNNFYRAQIEKGAWIDIASPTDDEIDKLVNETGVHREFLIHPLDIEERARIDSEDGQIMIIVDIPIECKDGYHEYVTIPLGIILVRDDFIITVCSEKTDILKEFKNNKIKAFYTFKKTRFVFQILHQISKYYLKYLNAINRKTDSIERELHVSMKNQELFNLLSLEKSLVYFTTSLKSNDVVMEKILRIKILNMYDEDQDVLEDAIIENKQAIEMAHIYSSILSGMMDAFASVISNNLNIVMKSLTIITIAIAIPTMVSSFFGMNITNNFEAAPLAFPIIVTSSIILSAVSVYIMLKRKQF